MPPERIRGERTALRPVTPADLDLLAGWLADPEIFRYWGGAPIPREVVREEYVERRSPDVEMLVIEADCEPVGFLQYWTGEPGAGGIDMFLIPSKRGQRLGPDAARAVVRYLIDDLGWRRVTVDPSTDNGSAIRGWERAGFVYERDWPDHPDGPSVLMAIDLTDGQPVGGALQPTL